MFTLQELGVSLRVWPRVNQLLGGPGDDGLHLVLHLGLEVLQSVGHLVQHGQTLDVDDNHVGWALVEVGQLGVLQNLLRV